jgi:hypothetical protein
MVAIAVVLAAVILFLVTGVADDPEFASAGLTVSAAPTGGAAVQVVDMGTAEELLVRCGTDEASLTTTGQTAVVDASGCERLTVIGVKGDTEQVVQRPSIPTNMVSLTPNTFPAFVSCDVNVSQTGSNPTLADGLAVAVSGDTICIENTGTGEYDADIKVVTDVTLVTESGATLVVPNGGTLVFDTPGDSEIESSDIRGETTTSTAAIVKTENGPLAVSNTTVVGAGEGLGLVLDHSAGTSTLDNVQIDKVFSGMDVTKANADLTDVTITNAYVGVSLVGDTATSQVMTIRRGDITTTHLGIGIEEGFNLNVKDSRLNSGTRAVLVTALSSGFENDVDVSDSVLIGGGLETVYINEAVDPSNTVEFSSNWWGMNANPTVAPNDVIGGGGEGDVVVNTWCTDSTCASTTS